MPKKNLLIIIGSFILIGRIFPMDGAAGDTKGSPSVSTTNTIPKTANAAIAIGGKATPVTSEKETSTNPSTNPDDTTNLLKTFIKSGGLEGLDYRQRAVLLEKLGLPSATFKSKCITFAWKTGETVVQAAVSQGIGLLLNHFLSHSLSSEKYPTTDREQCLAHMKAERTFLKKINNNITEENFFQKVSLLDNHAELATQFKSLDAQRTVEEILLEIYISRCKYMLFLKNEAAAVRNAQIAQDAQHTKPQSENTALID